VKKEVNLTPFNNDAIYNMKDVIEQFPAYLGMSLEELKYLFQNYETITKEQLQDYVTKNQGQLKESQYNFFIPIEKLISIRIQDYEYFEKVLAILSKKGLEFLSLIEYLGNLKYNNEEIEIKENILKDLNIFHYSSIAKGNDINNLLIALSHLIDQFNEFLRKINSFQTYHEQNIDDFALHYGTDKIYPSTSLRLETGERIDKTSLMPLENKTFKTPYKVKNKYIW